MKDLQIIQNDDGVFDLYDDTYDIAIHCTSQEEQDEVLMKLNNRTMCTDAIDRAEVLSHAKTDRGNGHEQPFDYVEVDVIKQLPLVTPAEKVGHWIDHQEDRWIYAKCSECGTVHDSRTNYCPNCGCHMEGKIE